MAPDKIRLLTPKERDAMPPTQWMFFKDRVAKGHSGVVIRNSLKLQEAKSLRLKR